jgi:hypothetical protein
MINPKVPTREPTLGRVDNKAESPTNTIPAKNPTIPIRISKTARMVIPIGREGLRIIE